MDGYGRSFGVCREIQDAPLTATDKIVGMVLALAKVKGRDFARMSLATIMARSSLSERTVQKAIKNLESAGILRRVRTGRAAIYRFQTDKSRKIVEAENSAGQTRKNLRVMDQSVTHHGPFHESEQFGKIMDQAKQEDENAQDASHKRRNPRHP